MRLLAALFLVAAAASDAAAAPAPTPAKWTGYLWNRLGLEISQFYVLSTVIIHLFQQTGSDVVLWASLAASPCGFRQAE